MLLGIVMLFASAYVWCSDAAHDEYKKINQGFLDLVVQNDVTGREYDPEGRNLNEIKAYFERHKNKIDFNCLSKTNGCGQHTVLSAACAFNHCSVSLVQFLCDSGANPSENKTGDKGYPGNYCLSVLSSALCGNATDIVTTSREKFAILKSAAQRTGRALLIVKNCYTKAQQEDDPALFEGTEFVE